jgi:hypothetical protein
MSLSPGSSLPFSAVTYAKKIYHLHSLTYQGQHESVSRYRGVWSVLPTDFFELLLSLAIFWLVRRVLFRLASMILSGIRLCLTPRCIAVCSI